MPNFNIQLGIGNIGTGNISTLATFPGSSPVARPDTRHFATVGIYNDIRSDVW